MWKETNDDEGDPRSRRCRPSDRSPGQCGTAWRSGRGRWIRRPRNRKVGRTKDGTPVVLRAADAAFSAPRMRSFSAGRMGRQRFSYTRPQRSARFGMRSQRFAGRQSLRRTHAHTRLAMRQHLRTGRAHTRMATRNLSARRVQHAQNLRSRAANRMAQTRMMAQSRTAMRAQARSTRLNGAQSAMRVHGQMNRQAGGQTLLAQRRGLVPSRVANTGAFASSRFAATLGRTPANESLIQRRPHGSWGSPSRR